MFDGADANLSDYEKFHENNGSTVEFTNLNTTSQQEQTLIDNMLNLGGAMPFTCAESVSTVLDGVYGIESSSIPGILQENAENTKCHE